MCFLIVLCVFSDTKKRATDLSTLEKEELEKYKTNNLISERDLSWFDRESRVAKCRNRKFKAKNIRNNMVLYKRKKEIKLDKVSKKIALILGDREVKWTDSQKQKLKERVQKKLNKAIQAKDYTAELLRKCKAWGGPCTSVDELSTAIKNKPDQEEDIVKAEMAYYCRTHRMDKIARPALFKQNGISHEEKLENLAILLDDDNISCGSVVDLPTNEQVVVALSLPPDHQAQTPVKKAAALGINQLCAVVWKNSEAEYEWYIGYVTAIEEGTYTVDHLHRKVKTLDTEWKYPSREDVQQAEEEQIVQCPVEGEWDITPDKRKRIFVLRNRNVIVESVKNHVL